MAIVSKPENNYKKQNKQAIIIDWLTDTALAYQCNNSKFLCLKHTTI